MNDFPPITVIRLVCTPKSYHSYLLRLYCTLSTLRSLELLGGGLRDLVSDRCIYSHTNIVSNIVKYIIYFM